MLILRLSSRFSQFLRPQISYTAVKMTQSRGYAEAQMPLTFASTTKVFYNQSDIKQVDIPSYSGSFGILPNHVPAIAMLKPGVVTVYEQDGSFKKFFVSSGSVTINNDSSVQVLAEEAVPVENLDPQACREGLHKAQQDLGSATTDEARTEANIAVEVHEALIRAVE
ncbi:ATP synthase subunit delta, mitochondrial-like [Limulus polyphemus]|uniref:ATP synthase subunit delta, mitochondrial-like n=1 Tax=Limulus polyphemus TaxID=6850 RepID=A0ABM1BEK4_LIMPO|nr:ATP synthase subunit delta, mitochondrial-like [Limulus polyphemus]